MRVRRGRYVIKTINPYKSEQKIFNKRTIDDSCIKQSENKENLTERNTISNNLRFRTISAYESKTRGIL